MDMSANGNTELTRVLDYPDRARGAIVYGATIAVRNDPASSDSSINTVKW